MSDATVLLTRAIERLETLKRDSTPGPLEAANAGDVFTVLGATNAHGVAADANDAWQVAAFTGGLTFVSDSLAGMPYSEERANRNLFLTLHRTIDAQLAILNDALETCGAWGESALEGIIGDKLMLARAVLGDDV